MSDVKINDFPFEIQDLDPETNASLLEQFEEHYDGYVRVGPKGYFLPKTYKEEAPGLYNMEFRPDHLFVGGFPRSGTTWTQQLVWLILNDLDYSRCDTISMDDKFLYIEKRAIVHQKTNAKYFQRSNKTYSKPAEILIQRHSYFKTHLPLSLLPPNLLDTAKMVYVARDPRDVIVSNYHISKEPFQGFKGDLKTMSNLFFRGTLLFCPYFEHVKEAWEKRDNPNMLFLFYEDIHKDRLDTLRRVASFFNKSYSDKQLLGLCNYIDFDNLKDKATYNHDMMRKSKAMNQSAPFVRKGKVGGWREHFDEEMTREADQWIADNLRDTDLRFPSIELN